MYLSIKYTLLELHDPAFTPYIKKIIKCTCRLLYIVNSLYLLYPCIYFGGCLSIYGYATNKVHQHLQKKRGRKKIVKGGGSVHISGCCVYSFQSIVAVIISIIDLIIFQGDSYFSGMGGGGMDS